MLSKHALSAQVAGSAALAPQSFADGIDRLPVTPPAEVTMANVAPILDLEEFKCLIEEIDLDGVRETLDVFLAETPERVALLRRLSCQSDRAQIKEEAHTLKGASGMFGLRQVSDLARTLELSAQVIAPEDYDNLVDRLDACFQRARGEATAALATVDREVAAHQG
jgi:HPt (histidine-containing phosphotransfer) domain-containing protein